jgi:hypothetical protein
MKRLALIVLCACGAPPPPPAAPAAPARDSCEALADHVISLMSAAQKVPSEQLDPFRAVLTRRCSEDRWSEPARRCLLGITSLAAGDTCQQDLTPAQQQALARDGQAALGAMGSAQPSQ